MIGILVATHGRFAEGLLNAVELIAGKQEKVSTIGLFHGDGIDEFEEKIQEMTAKLDDGDGVLAFADISGGSPSNTLMKLTAANENLRIIANVNMSMLVEAVMIRGENTIDELCDMCYKVGCQPPALLHEQYKKMCITVNEEDEF